MTAVSAAANYAALIDRIFGTGTATFSPLSAEKNNVTGALASDQFDTFTANFIARLERLKPFSDDPRHWPFVKKALNEIQSSRNWDGAYAELAALDYLITTLRIKPNDLKCDMPSPATATAAASLGMTNVDHDFYLKSCDAFIDVKILSDKTRQLLDGVVAEALKKLSINGLNVLSFHDADLAYNDVQKQRSALVSELINALANDARPTRIRSSVVSTIEYQPVWKAGVFMAEGAYSPADHGERHKVLLFQHAKKFHKERPTFIAFVHFPWASEQIPPLAGVTEDFFRELALQFFTGFKDSTKEASAFNSKFKKGVLADDVTRDLAGVIYLEDKTILGNSRSKSFVEGSVAYNPRYRGGFFRTLRFRFRLRALFGLEHFSKWKYWVRSKHKTYLLWRRNSDERRGNFR